MRWAPNFVRPKPTAALRSSWPDTGALRSTVWRCACRSRTTISQGTPFTQHPPCLTCRTHHTFHASVARPRLVFCVMRVAGEAAVAYETLGQVPRATSYLLFGCAGTQALASITGACGFHWLNRECLCTSVSILSLAIFALAYVTGATYLWLRDTNPAHPGHLFLVFGISAVADFFMFCTLIFVLILYRRLLTDFRESESAHEMREEYSDYATRDRPASGRSGSKRRGSGSRRPRPREYLPSDSL